MHNLVAVGVYLAALVGLGAYKARQVRGQAGFTLAGRDLGLFVLTGTLLATWTGTGSIFGLAEESWRVGLPALALPLGSALGLAVLALLCVRVRRHGAFTLQDILEERFGPAARVLGALTLVSAYLVIVSYQFRAAALVLERLLQSAGLVGQPGLDATLLVFAVAGVVGLYTALAGLASVSLTDTFNGVLMTLVLFVALPLTWRAAGGLDAGLAALPATGRGLAGHYTLLGLLSATLPTFLLVIGDANLHTRFLAARSDAVARRGALLLVGAVLVLDGVIVLLAVGGRALLPDLPGGGRVILELALTSLPPLLGALLVAAIMAVIVSTADSYLLSAGSSLLRDVYQRFLRPDADEGRLLGTARVLVLSLSALGAVLALSGQGFFDVALLAYTIYGVGITPPLLAALFWKRATPAGALASMLAGSGAVIVWEAADLGAAAGAALGLPPGERVGAVLPAAALAGVLLVGVSLVTRPRRAA